jgi:hypothetical protein
MECLKSTIVHRLILTTILSAASISIAAQEHQFHQKVTGLKDTSCTSANERANGFYQRICGVEEEGNYAVIDGVAFTYEKAQPDGAFGCSYATHSEVMTLASMLGERVYTPYGSVQPRGSNNQDHARGMDRATNSNGNRATYYIRTESRYSSNYYYPSKTYIGTKEALVSAVRQTSDTNGYVPSGDLVETLAAYRACEA